MCRECGLATVREAVTCVPAVPPLRAAVRKTLRRCSGHGFRTYTALRRKGHTCTCAASAGVVTDTAFRVAEHDSGRLVAPDSARHCFYDGRLCVAPSAVALSIGWPPASRRVYYRRRTHCNRLSVVASNASLVTEAEAVGARSGGGGASALSAIGAGDSDCSMRAMAAWCCCWAVLSITWV